jgi:hypothetical protein
MRIFPLALIFFALHRDVPAAEKVVLIGHFSSLRATEDEDPHTVEGYAVHLYRSGSIVFGNLSLATGALETAQGRLSDITFDAASGKLAFKAKPATGRGGGREAGPQGRALRDLYIFTGRITPRRLAGLITHEDGYALEKAGEKSSVSLNAKTTRGNLLPWTSGAAGNILIVPGDARESERERYFAPPSGASNSVTDAASAITPARIVRSRSGAKPAVCEPGVALPAAFALANSAGSTMPSLS